MILSKLCKTMKKINQPGKGFALLIAMLLFISNRATSQTGMPEILTTGNLQEQLNYVQEHTLIYENYRAIREDMFQKIKVNASDSLSAAKGEINGLKKFTFRLHGTIDSLNRSLESTKASLEEVTETKNSIRLLGIEVNKISYNAIMWMIVAGLLTVLAIGFLGLKRNMVITIRTKKEFEELKNEFETYRKASREAREKMSMAHFNEIKKLKGG
jgi:hypothetical protein